MVDDEFDMVGFLLDEAEGAAAPAVDFFRLIFAGESSGVFEFDSFSLAFLT